ncbi:MAG: hypothetical protein U1E84_02195 [Rhodoferax sp.]
MLKEVGASGQISLGKKYAGQLFDVQTAADGTITLQPVKVVPVVQEEAPAYLTPPATPTGGSWLTPERLARRAAAAARSPAEMEAARNQWEEENTKAIAAMNQRMAKIGSMGIRIHEWRKAKALREQSPSTSTMGEGI